MGRKKAAITYCKIKCSPTRNIENKILPLLNLTDQKITEIITLYICTCVNHLKPWKISGLIEISNFVQHWILVNVSTFLTLPMSEALCLLSGLREICTCQLKESDYFPPGWQEGKRDGNWELPCATELAGVSPDTPRYQRASSARVGSAVIVEECRSDAESF